MDYLYSQRVHALFKMAHRPLACQLLFDGRLGLGFVCRMLVQIDAFRDAIAQNIPLHAVHGWKRALVVIKTAMHGICGIVDVSHEHANRSPALEPVMMGTIQLDHLPEMGFPLAAL